MQNGFDPFADDAGGIPPAFYPLAMEGNPEAPEGLLSWMVGLAQAHGLGPRAMLKDLFAKHERYSDIWTGSAFFERDSATVNGLGTYAQMLCDLLKRRSGSDLEEMTLQSLSHLLSRNGEGLLARNPRWCHHCLCEQARLGQRPHLPLVWSLEYYRVCHVHHVTMQEHCPACGSTQSHLPCYPSLLHCGICGESMLAPLPEDISIEEPEVTEFENWCSVALVDLVSKLNALQSTGSLLHLRSNVEAIVKRFTQGNRKRLCEEIGLQIYALNGWVNKNERPSLAVLLRLCHGIGLMPAFIFLPDAYSQVTGLSAVPSVSGPRQCRPMLGYRQRERIERRLKVILADASDHRGLAAVAEQVGLSRHALKYWFPRQSIEIVRKNRACEDRRLELRYEGDHDFLRAVVQNMCADGVYPSRRRVNAELSERRISLLRPDIFQAYQHLKSAGGLR